MSTHVSKNAKGASLHKAKAAKNDEFYTQLSDIEKELNHYKDHFKGKVVFCNCDDPEWSSFWKYFSLNFEHLGLKKLIATHYERGTKSYKLEFEGRKTPEGKPVVRQVSLEGDGDFRSDECIAILKEADIVVTNPPFSLFREYVAQLVANQKRFLIIGSQNAITYKETFKLIRENQLWLGNTKPKEFVQSDGSIKAFGNIGWYTNLSHQRRNEELILFREYAGNEHLYPKYENYDAIEVSKVADIPADYTGSMGVPITFLDKFNPAQFEIIGLGISNSGLEIGVKPYKPEHKKYRKEVQQRGAVDGDLYLMIEDEVTVPYARIIIKRKARDEN